MFLIFEFSYRVVEIEDFGSSVTHSTAAIPMYWSFITIERSPITFSRRISTAGCKIFNFESPIAKLKNQKVIKLSFYSNQCIQKSGTRTPNKTGWVCAEYTATHISTEVYAQQWGILIVIKFLEVLHTCLMKLWGTLL